MIRRLLLTFAIIAMFAIGLTATTQSASAINVFPLCKSGQVATDTNVCQPVKNANPNKNPVVAALKSTIVILSIVIGIVALIVIITSALSMITSNGDAQAVAKARSNIIYALVGLAISAVAVLIVNFVLSNVG